MMAHMQTNNSMLLLLFLIILATAFPGCAYKQEPYLDPAINIHQIFSPDQKLPLNAGYFFNDGLRNYSYEFAGRPSLFDIQIGQNFLLIWAQVSKGIFSRVVEVDSLPPYPENKYRDIEVVIHPEITACYANLSGSERGNIGVEINMRLTAYDLDGNVVWMREGGGYFKSTTLEYWSSLVNYWTENTAQRAIFAASERLVRELITSPPDEINSLISLKKISDKNSDKYYNLTFNQAADYFAEGYYHYSYIAFSKAETILPGKSEKASYYKGLSAIYTGWKDEGIYIFNKINHEYPETESANAARIMLKRLSDKKKIGIVVYQEKGRRVSPITYQVNSSLGEAIGKSKYYDYVEAMDIAPPVKMLYDDEMRRFLDRCYSKRMDFVIYASPSFSTKPAVNRHAGRGTDVGIEKILNTRIMVFPTLKKNQEKTFSFTLTEQEITMEYSKGNVIEDIRSMSRRTTARLFQMMRASHIF